MSWALLAFCGVGTYPFTRRFTMGPLLNSCVNLWKRFWLLLLGIMVLSLTSSRILPGGSDRVHPVWVGGRISTEGSHLKSQVRSEATLARRWDSLFEPTWSLTVGEMGTNGFAILRGSEAGELKEVWVSSFRETPSPASIAWSRTLDDRL